MKSREAALVGWGLVVACGLLAGCEAVARVIGPQETTVALVNNGDFDVDVVLCYGDDQDVLRDVLVELGTRVEQTVAPGQTYVFSRSCDDLQAVVIDNADLRVVGGIGPEDHTDVLRDGTDFHCDDTLTFTFDHSDLLMDFRVTTSIQ